MAEGLTEAHLRVLALVAGNCRKTTDRRLINAVAKANIYRAGEFRNRIASELETMGLIDHVWTAHGWEWCIRREGRVALRRSP